jgi:hypothetical protein
MLRVNKAIALTELLPREKAFAEFYEAKQESTKLLAEARKLDLADEVIKNIRRQNLKFELLCLLNMPPSEQAKVAVPVCRELKATLTSDTRVYHYCAAAYSVRASLSADDPSAAGRMVGEMRALFKDYGTVDGPRDDLYLARDLARVGLAVFGKLAHRCLDEALVLYGKHEDALRGEIGAGDPKLAVFYSRALLRSVARLAPSEGLQRLDKLGCLLSDLAKANKDSLCKEWFAHLRSLVYYKAAWINYHVLGDIEGELLCSANGYKLFRSELYISAHESHVSQKHINDSDDEDAYLPTFYLIDMLQRLKESCAEFGDILIFESDDGCDSDLKAGPFPVALVF